MPRPMFINATTRQQISIYSIGPTDICFLVAPHLEKWGYKIIFFARSDRESYFVPPTFKSVAPPMPFPITLASGLYNSLYYRTSRDDADIVHEQSVQ